MDAHSLPTQGTIVGTVTLDHQPLVEGVVRFVPVDGSLPTASAPIADGTYQLELTAGTYRMEFSAPQVTGKRKMYDTPDSPEVDIVVELLPERYNVRSALEIQVHRGRNRHEQELSSAAQ